MKMQKNLLRLSLIKTIFSTFVILSSFCCSAGQQTETENDIPVPEIFRDYKKAAAPVLTETEEVSVVETEESPAQKIGNAQKFPSIAVDSEKEKTFPPLVETAKPEVKEKNADKADIKNFGEEEPVSQIEDKEKFHWKPALLQSGIFLGIQHGFRMTQEKTRRELGGSFFRDWAQSVKALRGWKDGDNFFTNYIAHPLQGGLTGRIFVNNSDRAKKQEFGKSKKYWESRFKAFVWSAVWSTQFELGPISEASLGNVGIREKNGHSTMAWGDFVITPTLGTGVLIAEDAIDKYILKNWIEKKISSKFVIKMFRVIFTPTTSVANLLRLKKPSWRYNRPL